MTGKELKALVSKLDDSAEVWLDSEELDDLVAVESGEIDRDGHLVLTAELPGFEDEDEEDEDE